MRVSTLARLESDAELIRDGPVVDFRRSPANLNRVNAAKVTIAQLQARKGQQGIPALTAYDYPMARLLDEAGVPLLLVGDSVGMVMLGYPDTTHVTMEEMVHHTGAAARARPLALLGADLPYRAYDTPRQTVTNARRLLAAGAEYVKAEGGVEILPQVRALRDDNIPFMAHLGMLPQHVVEEGGKYRIKGRDVVGRQKLLDDAQALERAGAFACVLELVTPTVAAEITRASRQMFTLGIGSGTHCDGQILVTSDLVGAFPWFTPRFVTPRVQTGAAIRSAVSDWIAALALAPTPAPLELPPLSGT